MKESRKFIYYSLGIFAVYSAIIYFLGFFNIGLLSDDYLNLYDAINSTFYQKITGSLPFTNAFHIRPFYYLSLEKSITINQFLGLGYDNFVWFRIQNLMMLIFLSFTAGLTVYYLTKKASVSLVCLTAILLYPNNVNNICWMAARVDLICAFFYVTAILLFLLYSDSGKWIFLILSLFSFLMSLFTKELAITFPVLIFLFELYRNGKQGIKKTYPLLITFFIIVAAYFVFRISILGNNAAEITTLYQSFPLSNAPGVYARALIALSIPLDFITLNFQLRNNNKLIFLYLLILYGSLFYLFWSAIRSDVYKILWQLTSFFFVLITPYAIVGYIRPQMILLPFTIINIFILYIYSKQINESLNMKKNIFKVSFALALAFWIFWTGTAVTDWVTSYNKSIENVNNLINTKRDRDKKLIIIGNPGRYKQTFMFDKMTGAYNYWKEREFIIKDTINDVIQSAAFQESSIGAGFEIKNISSDEFEIKTKAPQQFFYIEGYNPERIRTGFKNKDISVEFTEFNIVDKPIKLTLKILNSNVECFAADGLGFKKIY